MVATAVAAAVPCNYLLHRRVHRRTNTEVQTQRDTQGGKHQGTKEARELEGCAVYRYTCGTSASALLNGRDGASSSHLPVPAARHTKCQRQERFTGGRGLLPVRNICSVTCKEYNIVFCSIWCGHHLWALNLGSFRACAPKTAEAELRSVVRPLDSCLYLIIIQAAVFRPLLQFA